MCYSAFVSAAQEVLSSTPGLPPGSEGDWDTDLCSLMETKLFPGHTGESAVGGCVSVTLLFQTLNWMTQIYLCSAPKISGRLSTLHLPFRKFSQE